MRAPSIRLALPAAVLLASAWAASAAAQTPVLARTCDPGELRAQLSADPRRVSIAGGRVSLVPAEGMRPIDAAESREWLIEQRLIVWENNGEMILSDGAGASISLWYVPGGPGDPEERHVVDLRNSVMESTERRFRWFKEGEPVRLGGASWVLYEYAHRVSGKDRHVQSYWTDFQGHGLMVRFSAPATDRQARARMAETVSTLRVHDCMLAPGEGAAATAAPLAAEAGRCDATFADPSRVAVAGGRGTLVPPDGMRVLPPDERAERFGTLYETVFDDDAGTVLGLIFSERRPSWSVDSPFFQRLMRREIERAYPEMTSFSQEVVALGSTRWFRVSYIIRPPEVDVDVHSHAYMGVFEGGGLTLVLTTVSPRWAAELERSLSTLEARDCAESARGR